MKFKLPRLSKATLAALFNVYIYTCIYMQHTIVHQYKQLYRHIMHWCRLQFAMLEHLSSFTNKKSYIYWTLFLNMNATLAKEFKHLQPSYILQVMWLKLIPELLCKLLFKSVNGCYNELWISPTTCKLRKSSCHLTASQIPLPSVAALTRSHPSLQPFSWHTTETKHVQHRYALTVSEASYYLTCSSHKHFSHSLGLSK